MKRKLVAIISVILCFLMIIGNVIITDGDALPKASAAELSSGICGNGVSYSFNSQNGVLTISGNGTIEDYDYSLSPFFDNSSIKTIIIESGVTGIGSYAFSRCSGISAVSIPQSVKTIGDGAFRQCTGLAKAEIPNRVENIEEEAFFGCTGLKKLNIPKSVLHIGDAAFGECNGLKEITVDENNTAFDSRNNCNAIINKATNSLIAGCSSTTVPDNIEEIGAYAFCGITELKSINMPDNIKRIGNSAFYGCTGLSSINFPGSIESIGSLAFSKCSALTEISIPDKITSISEKAFSYCYSLKNVTMPDSIKNIGASAFCGCTGLAEINIPDSVISIGEYAFNQCTGLKKINIPASVTNLGKCAFSECTALTEMSVDSANRNFDSRFNCNAIIRTATNTLAFGCASTTIDSSVTGISEYAFYNCFGLTSIEIPDSVKSIGSNAFYGVPNIIYHGSATGSKWGAENLNCHAEGNIVYSNENKEKVVKCNKTVSGEIELPNTVKEIADGAFENCIGLTGITLSPNITSIGDSAFYHCTGLKKIAIPDNVIIIGDNAFYECTGLESAKLSCNLDSIGENAFYGCTNITSLTVPDCVSYIGNSAFENVLNIVYNGTASGNRWGAKNLNCYASGYLVYSDSVKSVIVGCGKSASGMLYIPETVRNIAVGAFNGCFGITSIYVDGNNTEYDSRNDCNAIIHTSTNALILGCNATVIPNDISSVAAYAFNCCKGLTEINLPESVKKLDEKAFYCNSEIESIYLPNGLESIGGYAFYGCTGLAEIDIPENVTSIGKYAFAGCNKIKNIVIPNGIGIIKTGTFDDCTELTELTIPNTITSIENHSFNNCVSLEDVYYGGTYIQSKNLLNIVNTKGSNNCIINASWHYLMPESITISSLPEKTKYLENEKIDTTGLKITANYQGGFSESIDDYYSLSPSVTGNAGTQTITVSYMGKSATFDITAEHSFTHYIYNNDAKIGINGTETAKCDNCNETHTRDVSETAKPAPLYFIKNINKYNGKTIDYRSSVSIYADILNCTNVVWHISGASYKTVSEKHIIIEEATKDFSVYFTATDFDGNTVTSETENIYVKHGFFDKLSAFFRGLFNKLPTLEQ